MRLQRLREFGLSEYAARAYLALLDLGMTEARDVSRLARVPLAKVYGTLDQLQARGLASVYPGAPKRFAPVPFAEFLEKQRQRHLSEIETLREMEDELVELFPLNAGSANVDDRGSVTTLRGRVNVLAAARDLLQKAERRVLVTATDAESLRLHALSPAYAGARERGVDVRFMAFAGADLRELAGRIGGVQPRVRPAMPGPGGQVTVLVVDSSTAVLAHIVPDDASLTRGEDFAVVITEAGVVHALEGLLARVWETAPLLPTTVDAARPSDGGGAAD